MRAFYTLLFSSVLFYSLCLGQELPYSDGNLQTQQISINGVQVEVPHDIDLMLFPQEVKSAINKTNTTPIHSRDNTTLKLDSLINNTQKRSFEYDEFGNVTYALAQRRANAFSFWVDTFANAYVYDAAGNTIEYIYYLWSPQESQMLENSKRVWQFDSNENEIMFTHYTWDIDLQNWIAASKIGSIYENNILKEQINEIWNSNSNIWQYTTKTNFTYNNNNLHTLSMTYSYNTTTSAWDEQIKRELLYNEDDLWVETLTQYWNNANNVWINSSKTLATYFSGELVSNLEQYSWNANQANWVGNLHAEFQYNNADQLIVHAMHFWNSTQNEWDPSIEVVYTLDEIGNRLESTLNIWLSQTNSWQSVSKYAFGLNLDILVSDIVLPTLLVQYNPFLMYSVNKISDANRYLINHQTGNLEFSEHHQYHYSEIHLTPVRDLELSGISVFPNPTIDQIQISFEDLSDGNLTFQLFDINGRVVKSGNIQSGDTIDLSHLAPGVYLYKISGENHIRQGKILKI